METVGEAAAEVPVARETEVLVCGGGPAGIAAALAAATSGARTLLLEKNPFLGGVWTAGALSIVIDGQQKEGLNRVLRETLEAEGAALPYPRHSGWTVYGLEAMKRLLERWMEAAGVEVQLYTQVAAAAREDGAVSGVFTESKSGREFVRAKVTVDATGDGDVAARAGCAYEKGRPSDGKMQPMTLYARVGGLKDGMERRTEAELLADCRAAGWDPSYERVTLFAQPGQPGIGMLMANHVYGVDATDVRDLTRAERTARAELHEGVRRLRASGLPDWRGVFLIDTGPFIGVREGRRIHGRYMLTQEDLLAGRRFPDAICEVTFGVDIHHCDPREGKGLYNLRHPSYTVPYRALVARDVERLLLAGRCISGDHVAHASYRVTGDAVAMGEAAGVAAAQAVASGGLPSALDAQTLLPALAAWRAKAGALLAAAC